MIQRVLVEKEGMFDAAPAHCRDRLRRLPLPVPAACGSIASVIGVVGVLSSRRAHQAFVSDLGARDCAA